ncbi:hypothetical protein JJ685_29500 [Ramlibacter monticola]|uniref:Zorya protein ZorC EH domain-containing protein n=1 Tax=Ramlibacter monticola TaxID=1926872 RepID=A0A936Z6F1_9BURK|nr:EH signature domain-containing protein [Ramlibacter monticola]MBL0395304.1 hypothetical protein [Ramlibacter monticola]
MQQARTFRAAVWGNPKVMTEALRSIRRDFGGSDAGPQDGDALQCTLQKFGQTRQVGSFTELKHVCYGLTVPVGEAEWRVIDRAPLFNELLGLVDRRQNQPKQFRRCYQGLLNGYFIFNRHVPQEGSAPRNWEKLQGFLHDRLAAVVKGAQKSGLTPEWVPQLDEHRNLLTRNACARYSDGLARGDTSEMKAVCSSLGIPSTSWVWEEALMEYVSAVCRYGDPDFRAKLPAVLKLVNGDADLKLPPTLATRAAAQTVRRYSHCSDKPERQDLRDTSLSLIGNPWLKRTAWDAHVDHEPARQMVEGWLKRRLIKDFFELLAQDGAADLRRLNYWLKWEPQITDMWFVLGSDARTNRSPAFAELRKLMEGRERTLVDSNGQNNAFVMRIGPLLVIEFGVTGNACYAFAASDFKTDLDTRMLDTNRQLKQRVGAKRLSHVAGWESRFDYELGRLLQSVPASKGHLSPVQVKSSRPNAVAFEGSESWRALQEAFRSEGKEIVDRTPVTRGARQEFSEADFQNIRRLCVQDGIEIEDNRPRGGALWVLLVDWFEHPGLAVALKGYGFQRVLGKGYWLRTKN